MAKGKTKTFVAIAPKTIDMCVKLMAKVSEPFASVRRLTMTERKRVLKFRKGGQQVVATLLSVCSQYGLEAPGAPMGDLAEMVDHAERIAQLLRAVEVLRATLKDELSSVRGTSWAGLTTTYAMLKQASRTEPNIATEIAKVESFFRHRAPKGATTTAAATAKPAPATSTTTSASTAPSTTAPSA
jgi:hypothetical protein